MLPLSGDGQGKVIYCAIEKADLRQPNNNITLYPNPVTDKLYIQSRETIQGIAVVNMMGKTVRTFSNINAEQAK
jgi:hypothetical protein